MEPIYTVEDCAQIDIKDFSYYFKTGTVPDEVIHIDLKGNLPVSLYAVPYKKMGIEIVQTVFFAKDRESDKISDYSEIIPVDFTKCNFGGKRFWFICRDCNTLHQKLYMRPDTRFFLCIKCLSLTYESRKNNYHSKIYNIMRNLNKYDRMDKTKMDKYYNGKKTKYSQRIDKTLNKLNKVTKMYNKVSWEKLNSLSLKAPN